MFDDRYFFKLLEEKYGDLLKVSVKKKYIFLIPSSKFVTAEMQNKQFYDNHTFYQCEYDPNLYISLLGKVLQKDNSSFQTFLGFKKSMIFNVNEEFEREVSVPGVKGSSYIKVIYIDNVVDESCYNPSVSNTNNPIKRGETFVRYSSKEEYLSFFKQNLKSNLEMKEVETLLNEKVDRMINNYILIKNHVLDYSMYFQEEFNPLKKVRYLF